MVYIPYTLRYGIECDSYRVQKYFPKSYEELQEEIRKISPAYYTPFPSRVFEADFDWKKLKYVGVMFLTAFKLEEDRLVRMETFVLQETNVFIMNSSGATIDRLKI